MSEQLAAALFWLIVLIPIGVFAQQLRQVRRGRRGKFKGATLFFVYSILPVLTAMFAVAVWFLRVPGNAAIQAVAVERP